MYSYYATAEFCLNGHCTCENISKSPNLRKKFCPECAARTITSCTICDASIPGQYVIENTPFSGVERQNYCSECGSSYPWTEAALTALAQTIEEDEQLSAVEISRLTESLPDILSETPKTQLAAVRFKKSFSVVGKYTADSIRQFSIDFGCELAKKLLAL